MLSTEKNGFETNFAILICQLKINCQDYLMDGEFVNWKQIVQIKGNDVNWKQIMDRDKQIEFVN